jgi:hypothetical protein
VGEETVKGVWEEGLVARGLHGEAWRHIHVGKDSEGGVVGMPGGGRKVWRKWPDSVNFLLTYERLFVQ